MKKKIVSKKAKKKYTVKVADGFMKDYENVPDDVSEALEKFIKDVKDGTIDPANVGNKMNLVECETKLLCGKCGSKNVSWMLDKNSDEIYFKCFDCGDSYWIYDKEYQNAIKFNPDCIIKDDS